MAAGRHGGYRDSEIRDRDSDVDVGRRRDYYYSNGEYERRRERGRARESELNGKDRIKVRQKDIKEREMVNGGGGYRSSSSGNSSSGGRGSSGGENSRRDGFSVRTADREPGELSSGSGSDGIVGPEIPVKDSEVSNGPSSPLSKKRKFSPIVWDREDKDVKVLSKNCTVQSSTPLPPPPPLPKSFRQSPSVVSDGGIHISPINANRVHQSPSVVSDGGIRASPANSNRVSSSQPSPVKPTTRAPDSAGSVVSDSPAAVPSSSLPLDHLWNYDREPGQLEEEDIVSTRNISSSRWADEISSPRDEGEVLGDEQHVSKKRKTLPAPGSRDSNVNTKLPSPELGEFTREGSTSNRAKSLESDRGRLSGSASEDDYPENELEKSEFMDVDGEDEKPNTIGSSSDTDSDTDDDSRATPEPVGPPQRSINMLQGCRSVDEFERLNKIDEGTYGVVYRAKDKKTGEVVALKKVKMEKEREGFPLTSLREINILLSFHHPSIVDVKEVVVGSNLDSIFMVMEYMEHDLKALMETMKQPFSQSEVKCLMLQLLEGVKYLHDNWVLHRDLKTSNLLLNNRGELKICDFGLARQYGSPLKPYTHLVVTLWYRAPELLLGAKQYSTAIDMWSLGCIMAELLAKEPLFNGKTEVDQLDKIFRMLGTPNETIWPGFSKLPGLKVNFVKQPYNLLRKKFPATSFTGSPILSDAGFDLLNKLLTYDPEKRITVNEALNHQWFREIPLPKSKDFMPTFPAQHAQDRRLRKVLKSPDPLEEQRRRELQQEFGTGGLFG
ncbi:hypothetical protein Scep_021035 [Stephania cephalantha]|uniref:cyclin-dependent kinase n=1 Tax=Stephania cephalantha TaxID=152367 RepID=A0AAP0I134_9MAGN